MPADLAPFHLTETQLADIRDDFTQTLRDGLSGKNPELKCIPAYLPKPANPPAGEACVIDLGGTNLRAGGVKLGKGTADVLGVVAKDDRLMPEAKQPGKVQPSDFFDRQAQLAAKATNDRALPVGYCFSYPAEIQPDGTATLIHWTKDVQLQSLEGENIAAKLKDRLNELVDGDVPSIFTVNDTVATLLAAVVERPGADRYIGLIAGTGTNTAAYLAAKDVAKLKGDWADDEIAVNLESGNFHPRHLTDLDDEFDRTHSGGNAGGQRFEKAMAGSYLPYLFARLAGDDAPDGFDPDAPDAGADLVELRSRDDFAGRAARALVDRSADLVAAKIAGLVGYYDDPGRVAVLGEGSFLTKTGGYIDRVRSRLDTLLPHARVELFTHDDKPGKPSANFVGAACAALLAK